MNLPRATRSSGVSLPMSLLSCREHAFAAQHFDAHSFQFFGRGGGVNARQGAV
jgi:hypothetical protein